MNESFEKQRGLAFLLTFLAMKKVRDKFLIFRYLYQSEEMDEYDKHKQH
jgi:hypothetical protein